VNDRGFRGGPKLADASLLSTNPLTRHRPLLRARPISTRVNKPENNDPSIVEPVELATDAA
jgi:putative SOS response-associated peptidase YedK